MKSPVIVVQWSVNPVRVNRRGGITVDQLRGAMHRACRFWEPVTAGMVEFRECHPRTVPLHNHIDLFVGTVTRPPRHEDRIAENWELPTDRSISRIILAEDVRWQSLPWPLQWGRQHWAWNVLAHELGHNLDIPHIYSEKDKPGLLEWVSRSGFSSRVSRENVNDWIMAGRVPTLKRRMTDLEAEIYRAYFINNGNHLWKGDLA